MRLVTGSIAALAVLSGGPAPAAEPRADLCQAFMTLATAATAQQRIIKVRVTSGWAEKSCRHGTEPEKAFCDSAIPRIGMEFSDSYPTGLEGCLAQNGKVVEARRDGGPSGMSRLVEVAPQRLETQERLRLTLVSGDLISGERLIMTVTPFDEGADAFDLEVRPAPKQGVAPGPPRR